MKKVFRIKGWFKQGLWEQRFTKEMVALSERQAMERLLSNIGSKHKIKRTQIHIEEVKEIEPEEVKNPDVRKLLV